MRKLIFGLLLLTFISCKPTEFCGEIINSNIFSELKGNVDFKGKSSSILMQVGFKTKTSLGEESDVNFEVVYDKNDTIVMNILNIQDEISAKKISCIINENKFVREANVVFVNYILKQKTHSFKY